MEGSEAVAMMSLGFGSTGFVPRTIAELLARISSIGNVQKRLSELDEYVGCLEEEMRKIHAFKRELPLCMLLLGDAIVYLKEESRKWCKWGSGGCSKVVGEPVGRRVEIDLMKDNREENKIEAAVGRTEDCGDKKTWMSSFQLWNSDLNSDSESVKKLDEKVKESKKCKMGDLLQAAESKGENAWASMKVSPASCVTFPVTLKDEKKAAQPVFPELSLVAPGVGNLVQKSNGVSHPGLRGGHQQSCRKQRRCWSPELHKAFVSALQQLGGPKVATPKQIRDLMRVDGLTNDEVKSHLQKYRLHIRRVPDPKKQTDASVSQSLGVSWSNNQIQSGESSKHSKDSESGSPPGPLDLDIHPRGISTSGGGVSMEPDEDENYSSYH